MRKSTSGQDEVNGSTSLVGKVESQAEEALTILWHELPTWLHDNHYIVRGYRPATNSYAKSASSLSYLHNESVNIWTHLGGAIVAVVTGTTALIVIRPRYGRATSEDVAVFSCYFLGATTCLGMSATYHTISNHSEAVAKFGNRLDYIGIIFLIWGSFIPSIYYGFSAEPGLIKIYWTMISTIAAATLGVIMLPRFRSSSWRPFRAGMFVAMGLSAVIPIIHGVQMYGTAQLQRQMSLWWVVAQGVLYITGAAIYAARVPERWSPGTFDIWGTSHQVFHVLVLLAVAVHGLGLVKAFDHEHSYRSGLMTAYESARKLGGPA